MNIVEPFAYGHSFVHRLDPRVKSITAALHCLYVPNKLDHLFFFAYRYIHVINLEYLRLTNAMKVRCFIHRNNLHTYKSFAYLIGMLILKSYERSRRIYNAMLCRAFKGKFYILELSLNSKELKDCLARNEILIRDCSTFDGMGDRYFRVAVKKHEQNMILIEKLKWVAK